MKLRVTLLSLIALSASAVGSEPADKKLAMEYLEVSRFEQITDASIEAYSGQLFKNLPANERVSFEKIMRDTMGWAVVKQDLAILVTQMYTKDELKAFVTFAKSRHGASFNAKSVKFSDAYSALLARNLQRVMEQLPSPQPNPVVNTDAPQ